MPRVAFGLDGLYDLSIAMDTRPFTRSQIFAVIWMAVVVAYLFGGPRNFTVSTEVSFLIVTSTIFALVTLGKRFPMFGLFLLMMITAAFRGGGRGRRRW